MQEATGSYARNEISNTAFPYNLFTNVFPFPRFFDNWSVGFDASWELDIWGRFRRAIEAADAQVDLQIANYDDVLVMLQAETAANYVQMRAFEQRFLLAEKNIQLQRKTLDVINLRYRAGLVTELDVQQGLSNLAITESLVPGLKTGRRRAQNRLCILLGMPPRSLEAELGPNGAIPAAPQEIVVGVPADLLRRRPDVRRAERQAAAQSAQIGIAESEFYPHLALTGAIGFQSEELSQLFQIDSMTGAIGPSFRWNILNYGRIQNNVKVQEARFQEALLTYRDTVLRADEEADGAIIAYLNELDRQRAALDQRRRPSPAPWTLPCSSTRRG